MALKTLDLFSGIGGFARGLEATGFFSTTCFVEQDPYCQAVLKHHWPDVPVLEDIRNVQGPDLPTRPDVICGGFPCQPFSHAGKQRAQDDPRHLWPEMFRLIRECRPTWVVGENVIGLVQLGLDEVLSDLENEGYATRTFNIPACAVGAPHIRQRLWIVAHADSESEPDGAFDGNIRQRQLGFDFVADATDNGLRRREQLTQGGKGKGHVADADAGQRHGADEGVQPGGNAFDVGGSDVSDARCGGGQGPWSEVGGRTPQAWWQFEPDVGRLAHGVPNRVSQLRALGNTIIPQIAEEIGYAIAAAEGAE